jgi:hypothetical protein
MLSGILFTERFGFWGNDMIDPADYYDLIVANSERLIFGPI